MLYQLKIVITISVFLCFYKSFGTDNSIDTDNSNSNITSFQIDSLILKQEKDRKKNLESSIEYFTKGLDLKRSDSTNLIKNLALIHAELNHHVEAARFTEKYIEQSLDISILNNPVFDEVRSKKEFSKLESSYLPKFNIIALFYLFTGFIGLFIAFVINFNKSNDRIANLLIGIFITMHSLFIMNATLYHMTNYIYRLPETMFVTIIFSYLYGPLLYFYFKRITNKYKFKPIDIIHFIPTLALLLYCIPYYFMSNSEKLRLMINVDANTQSFVLFIAITKFLSLCIYAYLIYKIFKVNKQNEKYFSFQSIKWQSILKNINIFYVITYLLYALAIFLLPQQKNAIHPQILLMSLLILYIAYTAYAKPGLFGKSEGVYNLSYRKKYINSGLTHQLSLELKDNLIKLFEEDKIYRDNSLNLEILAYKLGTTRHSASQVINEHFNISFFELVNKYRINEAINIIEIDSQKNLNIIDIAYEVGFNNKVTFNKAFKKETGVTPTEYMYSMSHDKNKQAI